VAQVVRERQELEALRKKAKLIAQQTGTFWAKAQRVVATKVRCACKWGLVFEKIARCRWF